MITIQGKGVSTGVAGGPLYFYQRAKSEITRGTVSDVDAEWKRFKAAQAKAVEQLGELAEKARAEAGDEAALLFETHQLMAEDMDYEEAIEEADYVINLLKGHNINGPVAYDWEINASNYRNAGVSKEVATACAVAFCEKMLAAGYAPIVYISQYVGYVKYDMGALRTYLKWYPQYPATSNASPFPNFRYQVDMWQFSDSVTIPGIGSNIDSNLWFWPK